MKRTFLMMTALCCLCLSSLSVQAQNDDSKYLEGAVPEVDGKVVFSKEFRIPGMSGEEVFERTLQWMTKRLAQNENTSRVVLQDAGKGQVVGLGDEWIVFSSSALALDRTRILYQLYARCAPEQCTLEISKVSYVYREGKEKYKAEEWIVDKYALNKAKTKLVVGLAKWRRRTVDLMDNLCLSLADALRNSSTPTTAQPAPEEKKEEKSVVASGVLTITSKPQVEAAPAIPEVQIEEPAPAETRTTDVQPAATNNYAETDPASLKSDLIQPNLGKLVIVIGEEPFNMTMMTANSGGSLGRIKGQPVVFTILSADQPYTALEAAENYVVRFYPNGATQPTVVLHCKKGAAPAAIDGMPRTYVGEIIKAEVKR